jgi:hypothetical protein
MRDKLREKSIDINRSQTLDSSAISSESDYDTILFGWVKDIWPRRHKSDLPRRSPGEGGRSDFAHFFEAI